MLISCREEGPSLCSRRISQFRPEATGEMQSDPLHSWELCSIYNARCTRLSSWINLTGMNASHWGYNMGGNGRVMSALPSHQGKMHQKMSPKRKLQYQSQIYLEMKMRRYIFCTMIQTLCFIYLNAFVVKVSLMLQRSLLGRKKQEGLSVWSILFVASALPKRMVKSCFWDTVVSKILIIYWSF